MKVLIIVGLFLYVAIGMTLMTATIEEDEKIYESPLWIWFWFFLIGGFMLYVVS